MWTRNKRYLPEELIVRRDKKNKKRHFDATPAIIMRGVFWVAGGEPYGFLKRFIQWECCLKENAHRILREI